MLQPHTFELQQQEVPKKQHGELQFASCWRGLAFHTYQLDAPESGGILTFKPPNPRSKLVLLLSIYEFWLYHRWVTRRGDMSCLMKVFAFLFFSSSWSVTAIKGCCVCFFKAATAIEQTGFCPYIFIPLDFHIHSASMTPFLSPSLLCEICDYIVPDSISQHSSEFTSPAIDLWHEAQEQRHECLWRGFKSRVFHWSRPGFSVISDMLTDVSIHELRLNPGLVKLWKCFGGVGKDCGYIYGGDYGCHETGKCWITPISI